MRQAALMLAAHPPGRGTGSAVRGAVSLEAIRSLFARVDVISLAAPGEERFADPDARLIARPGRQGSLRRVAMLPRGGTYFSDERAAATVDRVRALVAGGELLERYDLVWCHSALMARAAHVVAAGAHVLDIDNVPSADVRSRAAAGVPRRVYRGALAAALGREERRRADLHDLVTVTSPSERDRLGRVRPPVRVLPNTVPAAAPAPVADSDRRVLFVGSLHYGPNVDAVRWMAEEIVPRLRTLVPGVGVRVVGREPGDHVRRLCEQAGIELVADAPSLQPHHHAARVMLAPLRSGGGTKIKVLEALACGVPIVATPQAIDGLQLTPGVDVHEAADADGLARGLAALLQDAAAAARMGAAGRAVWAQRHDPAAARRIIERIVDDLIGPPHR